MPTMFQLAADTLRYSVCRMLDAEWYVLMLDAHVTLYFGVIDGGRRQY
jgi:hypothetical protein